MVIASRFFLVALAVGVVAGCDWPLTTVCTTDVRFGLVVEVRDSVTGAPAATGARLIAQDGDHVETSDAWPFTDGLVLQAAMERPGTYDLTVEKSGYRNWTRAGVRVRKDECHVIPVHLEARLQPAP